MIEAYPAEAGLWKKVDWWWAYGPMLFVAGIALLIRLTANRARSSIQRKEEH